MERGCQQNDRTLAGGQALTPADAAGGDDMADMRLQHPEWTLGAETAPWFATSWNLQPNAGAVVLLHHPPLNLVGFSIGTERGCQQNNSAAERRRNLAVPEVREHLLAAIVELAGRANWDGTDQPPARVLSFRCTLLCLQQASQ